MSIPHEVARNPIAIELDGDVFTADGLELRDPAALLARSEQVAIGKLPRLLNAGVQQALVGAIQDPAGSAIGAMRLSGGGASGAIYAAFPDLQPIPRIAVCSAIFNSSSGPGRRVVHSHSPQLDGDPSRPGDRTSVLTLLANTYANAIVAFAERAPELGDDGAVLNLVPVAASIYAGRFAHPRLHHLHPSYTLAAIVLAVAWQLERGEPVPELTLSYFGRDVFAVAEQVRDAMVNR